MIGLLLLLALAMRIPKIFFRVFLPPRFVNTLSVLSNADLIIWNGRNFRGNSFFKEPYNIWTLVYNPLVCIALKKPIACVKASMWPLRNPISRQLLRFVFRRCFFISVREKNSELLIKQLLGGKGPPITLLPDPSFFVLKDLTRPYLSIERVHNDTLQVGLTVFDHPRLKVKVRAQYIKAMQHIVSYVISELKGRVVVIPQATYFMEDTSRITEEILAAVDRSKVNVIHKEPSIEDLVRVYAELDFLIATRMHSAIFALAVGTPVLAIAYDPGSKWDILGMLGAQDIVINIDQVNEDVILQLFQQIWANQDALITRVQRNLESCYQKAQMNIELIWKLLSLERPL